MFDIQFNVGDLHLSLFSLVKGILLLLILLWGAGRLSRIAENRLKSIKRLEPSLQELFSKLLRTLFFSVTALFSLSVMGIDISAFTLIGGAIGVGIGFGLQKIVSNLVCGIILLLDRSIKPGDVIALDNGATYGIVYKLGARCVSVRTRSGKEHLIPNEDLITQRTENWSFSDSMLRLKLPVRVAFDADPRTVLRLLEEIGKSTPRVLKHPAVGARLVGLGDYGYLFELRIWIADPQNGLSQVRSDLYVRIVETLRAHGIKIPVPQLELASSVPVSEAVYSQSV